MGLDKRIAVTDSQFGKVNRQPGDYRAVCVSAAVSSVQLTAQGEAEGSRVNHRRARIGTLRRGQQGEPLAELSSETAPTSLPAKSAGQSRLSGVQLNRGIATQQQKANTEGHNVSLLAAPRRREAHAGGRGQAQVGTQGMPGRSVPRKDVVHDATLRSGVCSRQQPKVSEWGNPRWVIPPHHREVRGTAPTETSQ